MGLVWICKECDGLDPGPRKTLGPPLFPPRIGPCPVCGKQFSTDKAACIYDEQIASFKQKLAHKTSGEAR